MNDHAALPMTTSHWGMFRAETEGGKVTALHAFEGDKDPSPIGQGILDTLDAPSRIKAPMVRKSWLENGPGSNTDRRGAEPFVQVSWEQAETLVANELSRIRKDYGNEAIFGGSYGWSSAGRFHHAQSQVHRFLNSIGGYTRSVDTYSVAAGEVTVPYVLGGYREFTYATAPWHVIAEQTKLIVAFGGLPVKNGQIAQGGMGRHVQRIGMREAAAAGVQVVNISPVRSDAIDELNAEWLAARPSTDAAIMLGLAHTLLTEGLHDQAFLERYTVGFDKFAAYLTGETDGIVKDADWAATISDLPADDLRNLARRMAAQRTLVTTSWSLTRQDHGEQPFWATIALASMLGQIGLPGGGFGFGYSAVNTIGLDYSILSPAALPQGQNGVDRFIPVARISDMLLNPGSSFDYKGQKHTYPEIKAIYWAGGNPFHHHQHLNRMLRAWQKPDTIICHEWSWNAHAKHADIVLPCTTTLERRDFSISNRDTFVVSMEKVAEPVGETRDDYEIFSNIARRMGSEEVYTEGRDAEEWQQWLYDRSRQIYAQKQIELPTMAELRERGWHEVPAPAEPNIMLKAFRDDPVSNALKTPSGKIEIFSETVAGFDYDDCPGYPAWLEPLEWLGQSEKPYPLHLISNQPSDKLHSQLDHGSHCRASKIKGREPVMLHPAAASARGIADGDIVRLFNGRGACLAAAVLNDGVRADVVQLATGAWFDPLEPGTPGSICKHGNPNMLTPDKGTSRLAQGPIAHTCLIEIEKYDGELPPVTAYDPPEIIVRGWGGRPPTLLQWRSMISMQ